MTPTFWLLSQPLAVLLCFRLSDSHLSFVFSFAPRVSSQLILHPTLPPAPVPLSGTVSFISVASVLFLSSPSPIYVLSTQLSPFSLLLFTRNTINVKTDKSDFSYMYIAIIKLYMLCFHVLSFLNALIVQKIVHCVKYQLFSSENVQRLWKICTLMTQINISKLLFSVQTTMFGQKTAILSSDCWLSVLTGRLRFRIYFKCV